MGNQLFITTLSSIDYRIIGICLRFTITIHKEGTGRNIGAEFFCFLSLLAKWVTAGRLFHPYHPVIYSLWQTLNIEILELKNKIMRQGPGIRTFFVLFPVQWEKVLGSATKNSDGWSTVNIPIFFFFLALLRCGCGFVESRVDLQGVSLNPSLPLNQNFIFKGNFD